MDAGYRDRFASELTIIMINYFKEFKLPQN
jgi:hypothetical protein